MSGPRRVEIHVIGNSRSAQNAFDQLFGSVQKGETQLDRTARQMDHVGRTISRNVTRYVVPAAAGAVWAFGRFDSAMTQSTAIMDDVDTSMRRTMSDTAKQASVDLNIASSDAAQGFYYLAQAGWDVEQAVAGLPQVAAFAKAGMFDMSRATDLATDAQSALGLTVADASDNLENLTRVTDVLVRASTLANASVEQFSESLTTKAGAALRVMNKDVEEGVAVLAALADQGVKGAVAGESLNVVLRDVTRAAARNTETFADLGLEVFDTNGNLRHMADVVENMEQVFGPMNDATMAATLEQLGLTRSVGNVIRQLMGTSGAIRDYETELRSAGGYTEQVAGKQMEAFNEQLGAVRQQLVNAAIDVGEKLAPGVLAGGRAVATLAEAFVGLPGPIQASVLGLTGLVAASGPAFVMGGRLLGTYSALGKAITAAGGAKVIANRTMSNGVVAFANLVQAINPVTLGLTALGIGLGAYVAHARAARDATDSAAEAAPKLAESMGLAWEIAERQAESAAGAARSTEREFAAANANAIDRLRELSAEAQRDYLIQVGYQLTQQGATPEEAFAAIQRLADAAGITIPMDLEPPDLADFEQYLAAVRGTVEEHAREINRTITAMSTATREDFRGIGQAAGEAFATGDVAGFVSILAEAQDAVENSTMSFGAQKSALELMNQEALRHTDVQGLSLRSTEDLAGAIEQLTVRGEGLTATERDLLQAFTSTLAVTGDYQTALDIVAQMQGHAAAEAAELAAAAEAAGEAAGDAVDPTEEFADGLDDLEEAAEEARSALDTLQDVINDLIGVKMDAAEAEMRWIESLEALEEQVKESTKVYDDNGKQIDTTSASIDKNSEAGRDNRRAVMDAANAAIAWTEAELRNGASIDQVTATLTRHHIPAIRDTAREAGMTEDQINKLIKEYGLVPKDIRTRVAAEIDWASLRAVDSALSGLTGTRYVNVRAQLAGASTGAGRSHTGDIITHGMPGRMPGLAPDERLRILQVGEEVVTASDPRHARNLDQTHGGGLAGAGRTPVGSWGGGELVERLDRLIRAVEDAQLRPELTVVAHDVDAAADAVGSELGWQATTRGGWRP